MKKFNDVPARLYLDADKTPKVWHNLRAEMKELPDPMLNPATMQPVSADDLSHVFCKDLADQEFNFKDKFIDIPQEILHYYAMFRPSPLCRAYELEKALGTKSRIYYKFEGNNTSGSHKLNSAAAQVYYAKKQGLTSLTTETGAGQWGTALSMAAAHFGMDLTVFMVKVSSQQKPYRKAVMQVYGSEVIASPSDTTEAGRKILANDPNTGGSLGCAISEALELAAKTDNCRYVLGSVLDHVLLHQSVIGLEAQTAFKQIGDYPDIIVGCAGGGSNLGGLVSPFIAEKIRGESDVRCVAVEPENCPSLTKGKYEYDFGDIAKTTPLIKMYTLGSDYIPPSDHAGGLRYHGMSPIISKLYHDKLIDAVAVNQKDCFEAATLFAKTETILPAPESSHAILQAIREAKNADAAGEEKCILFGLSGTGYFDLGAYQKFMK